MCYRCGICGVATTPNQPRKVHIIYRDVPYTTQRPVYSEYDELLPSSPYQRRRRQETITLTRKDIHKEISICIECDSILQSGDMTYEELYKYKNTKAKGPKKLETWPER
jgi:hypothetical protein